MEKHISPCALARATTASDKGKERPQGHHSDRCRTVSEHIRPAGIVRDGDPRRPIEAARCDERIRDLQALAGTQRRGDARDGQVDGDDIDVRERPQEFEDRSCDIIAPGPERPDQEFGRADRRDDGAIAA